MKIWFKTQIGGQAWTIYLVSPNSKHLVVDGDLLDGKCVYPYCKIYIRNDMAEGATHDTLVHELLHAWVWVSGAGEVYENDYEKDERLVSRLTPYLHRGILDLGGKLPKK